MGEGFRASWREGRQAASRAALASRTVVHDVRDGERLGKIEEQIVAVVGKVSRNMFAEA